MRSTPEVDKIDSKRMRVDAMTKKGGLSFAEYCKCLLDICDEVGTKGDKKHEKREAKARLNQKYYLTCSSPRQTFFLHALSFEYTSKLCITFLNQFQFIFIFKKCTTQFSH